MLAKTAVFEATAYLQKAGVESASLDARLLAQHILGVSREKIIFSLDLFLTTEQYAKFQNLLGQRAKRKPIAKIIGKKEFWGREFAVSGDTLDPRPDSETLIEAVLERVRRKNSQKIIDLGTGTGCLLFSLLPEIPSAIGFSLDSSEQALEIARKNARNLHLEDRVNFIKSNWWEKVEGNFDIVISNPPYIASGDIGGLAAEVRYDPMLALDGGADGLDAYRVIIAGLSEHLAEGGFAALEIGIGQEANIEKIAEKNGLQVVEKRKDLGGIIRVIVLERK